jgi:hypothetical protein
MSKKIWICATCSEGFTRSYSADRHIRNLHSGLAKKVRLIDYMAGRASGEYFPADPSIYRANKKRHSMLGSSIMSHENVSNMYHHQGHQPLRASRMRDIKTGGDQQSHNNIPRSEEVEESEKYKESFHKFSVTSPRIEEVRRLLMLFSPPGEKPPPVVEKTLAKLSSQILEMGGDDAFLEGPLKELRKRTCWADAVGLLGSSFSAAAEKRNVGSRFTLQEKMEVHDPSSANLPEDAIEKLAEIEELLSPFHSTAFIQNKIKELVKTYYRTGDLSVFGRALADFLNNPS